VPKIYAEAALALKPLLTEHKTKENEANQWLMTSTIKVLLLT